MSYPPPQLSKIYFCLIFWSLLILTPFRHGNRHLQLVFQGKKGRACVYMSMCVCMCECVQDWVCVCVCMYARAHMCISSHRKNECLGQEIIENSLLVARNEMVKTWGSGTVLLGCEILLYHLLAVWSWASYIHSLDISISKWGWW